ncbi:MAG: site-specific integrase [Cyanobacteriota bacterium]
MTKEKIWKIARGLRKFTLDELLILAEVEESEAQTALLEFVNEGKVQAQGELYHLVNIREAKKTSSKDLQKTTFESIEIKTQNQPRSIADYFDPETEKELLEEFLKSPEHVQRYAYKYIVLVEESKGLNGEKLKFFVEKWNAKYPEFKASYSTILKYRKIFKEHGKQGLMANRNTKKMTNYVKDELYIKFRDLYLSHDAPSMKHCYKALKEAFEKENTENVKYIFPSTTSLLRRLRQDFTQAEINYYRSKAKVDFQIPIETKKNLNLLIRNNQYSFISAADHFLKDYAKVKCSPSTVASYESYLKNHLIPYFRDIRLKNINEKRINDFVNLKISEGLSKTSINHMLKLLGLILDATLEMDYIDKNPVKQIKQMRSNGKKPKHLKEEEVKKLLSIAKENYSDVYPLLYTAITTGMRKGELLGLTWQHVNLKTRKITIKKSLYRNRLIDIRATKQPRVITITKELAEILKEWKLVCPKSNQDIVFPNSTGGFMDPDNMIKRWFNPLVEQAGIQNIQFQDLRNTYAYIMLSNNATLEYVQTQMGHSSVDVTFNRYGHFLPEKKEDYESVFKDLARGL